jgi:acid phosphatase family membrane protein YuiD
MNPNDEIRRQILQYFYDRNATATSRMGKKGSAVKISDAKRELKARHGHTQQQVMANLTYLISNGWITTIGIEK